MRTRMPLADLAVLPVVLVAGTVLWLMYAHAWDLGGRSPYLTYDSAQIAIAARELAFRGQLRTLFALPADLPRHALPPWPVAGLAPGLILLQALVFRLVPAAGTFARSDVRAALTLVVPFVAYLFAAAALALSARHLFERWSPETPGWQRAGASLTLAGVFLLDPAAQHFAMGAHAELPYLVGLLFVTLGLALGVAGEHPLASGLVLGVTSLFRLQMLAIAPVFALLGGWCARLRAPTGASGRSEPGAARRALLLSLAGFAVIVAPVWWHEAHVLGSPLGDVVRQLLWDGREGREWFATFHRAATPVLPGVRALAPQLAGKLVFAVPGLLGAFARGPRLFELFALIALLGVRAAPRPLHAAALGVLAVFAVGVLASALAVPWFATLFPARMLVEVAGVCAAWALIARLPARFGGRLVRDALGIALALLALGWGALQTQRGLQEARAAALGRGTPSSLALRELGLRLNPRLEPREALMSNLGPVLAWYTAHAVVHLVDAPEEVEVARRFLDFHHVLLVFRSDERGWGAWRELLERPGAAAAHPALRVSEEERWITSDGFLVVWLRLAPRAAGLAGGGDSAPGLRGAARSAR